MNYTYNKVQHYRRQVDDIKDGILLGQTTMPNFIEFTNFSIIQQELGKFNWLKSGLSEHHGEVVAGSYLSSLFNKDISHNDVDIYFHSVQHAELWCKINGVAVPSIAHGLCGRTHKNGKVINLITGIEFSNAKNLIAGFDIRACAIAFDPQVDTAYAVEGAVDDCHNKRVVWQVGARSVTVRRLLKYVEKGFSIDNHQKAIFVELVKIRSNRDQELLGGYI